MGESETYYRLFSNLHLTESNLGVIFLPTGLHKSHFLKCVTEEEAAEANPGRLVKIDGREGKIWQ